MNDDEHRSGDDMEWDFLEGLWRRAPVESAVPAALQAQVHREEWRMRFWAFTEWLLAAVFVIWGVVELATFTDDAGFLRGFLLVWLTAVALSFSLRLRRGLWAPAAESTRAYLAISRARVRAGWRALRFAWLLFLFQALLFPGIEIAVRLGVIGFQWNGSPVQLVLAIVALGIVLAAWSLWYARTLQDRETALNVMRRELEEENPETPL